MVAHGLIEKRGHLHLLARDREIDPSLDPVASIHKDVSEIEGQSSDEESISSHPNLLFRDDLIPRRRSQTAPAILQSKQTLQRIGASNLSRQDIKVSDEL